MAVFEWARGQQHFDQGSTGDPYYLSVMEARDFHQVPEYIFEAEDVISSALFPYVTPLSYRVFGWRHFDPAKSRAYTGADYEDEQSAAYAKSLDVMTEEVAGHLSLPAFMGAISLR